MNNCVYVCGEHGCKAHKTVSRNHEIINKKVKFQSHKFYNLTVSGILCDRISCLFWLH